MTLTFSSPTLAPLCNSSHTFKPLGAMPCSKDASFKMFDQQGHSTTK